MVLAHGVATLDDYRRAKRTGRGVVLTPEQDATQSGRSSRNIERQLASRKLKEVDDAYRDAAALAGIGIQSTGALRHRRRRNAGSSVRRRFDCCEPWFPWVERPLLRRVTGTSASTAATARHERCGIDIRGRSRKLYLNYRTDRGDSARRGRSLEGVRSTTSMEARRQSAATSPFARAGAGMVDVARRMLASI